MTKPPKERVRVRSSGPGRPALATPVKGTRAHRTAARQERETIATPDIGQVEQAAVATIGAIQRSESSLDPPRVAQMGT